MSDSTEAKIQRWERYVEECRREAKLLSPEGQRTMQTVIDSYERLIALVRDQDKRKSYSLENRVRQALRLPERRRRDQTPTPRRWDPDANAR
jgi:hypothetical protein